MKNKKKYYVAQIGRQYIIPNELRIINVWRVLHFYPNKVVVKTAKPEYYRTFETVQMLSQWGGDYCAITFEGLKKIALAGELLLMNENNRFNCCQYYVLFEQSQYEELKQFIYFKKEVNKLSKAKGKYINFLCLADEADKEMMRYDSLRQQYVKMQEKAYLRKVEYLKNAEMWKREYIKLFREKYKRYLLLVRNQKNLVKELDK